MKRTKIVSILYITVTLFLFGIFLVKPEAEVISFEHLLKDVSIKKLSVGRKTYVIKNGIPQNIQNMQIELQLLRLAAFYQWDKEDPLFDSPDFDPSAFKTSLTFLNKTQQQLLFSIRENQPLFPIDFLSSLAQVSQQNKLFLKNPSDVGAKNLLALQKKTAEKYTSSASSFLAFVKPHINNRYTFITFNVLINANLILSDYGKILENGSALQSEIKKRENCSRGRGPCQRPLFFLKKPTLAFNKEDFQTEFLDSRHIQLQSFGGTKEIQINGLYKIGTNCFGFKNDLSTPDHYFYLVTIPPSDHSLGNSYYDVFLATDMFFNKLSKNAFGQVGNLLFSQGQKYSLEHSGAPYMCFDTGYINKLLELHAFLTTKTPILDKIHSEKQASIFEKQFFSGRYPSYTDLSLLGNYYGYLYSANVDPQLKEELLIRYLMIKNNMADLDKLVTREIPYTLRLYESRVVDKYPKNYNLHYIYPFRSDYGFMYFPFASSMWRSDQSLQYMENKKAVTVSPDSNLISYTQAKTLYSQDEISTWFRDWEPLYQSIIAQKESKN